MDVLFGGSLLVKLKITLEEEKIVKQKKNVMESFNYFVPAQNNNVSSKLVQLKI